MAILGTPYTRGNSDIITNKQKGTVVADEGVFVMYATGDSIVVSDGTKVVGVAGYVESNGRQSLVMQGIDVVVQAVAGETLVAGQAIYCNEDGLATSVFATDLIKVGTLRQGYLTAQKSDGSTVDDCIRITLQLQ